MTLWLLSYPLDWTIFYCVPFAEEFIFFCFLVTLEKKIQYVLTLMQDAKGNDVDLSIYKGKVLLIVNVASQWYYSLGSLVVLERCLFHIAELPNIC